MAYVSVDEDHTFTAEEGLHLCPQLVQIVTTDTPYLQFDFGNILGANVGISSASAVIESASKTITIADTSVDATARKVSFKVSGMSAGDFRMRSTITLSDGTTNTKSRDGIIRVT